MDERIASQIALTQKGLMERSQLLAAGMSKKAIEVRVDSGRWEVWQPGVYAVAGIPHSHDRALMAACLAAGPAAFVSHRAAAGVWGFAPSRTNLVEVTVPRPQSGPVRGVIVHRATRVEPTLIRCVDGLRVSEPALTLVDLGAVVPEWSVDAALNAALGAKLVALRRVNDVLAVVGGRGRRGAGVLRKILHGRGLDLADPESALEARFDGLLSVHGVTGLVAQFEVLDGAGRFVARVDFADVPIRLAVELEGDAWHSSPASRQRDRERRRRLGQLGWEVVPYGWIDVVEYPERTITTLQDRRRQRARELGVVAPL